MKTSLTTLRRSMAFCLVGLAALLSSISPSFAVKFSLSPSTPVTMRANNGTTVYRYVTINNLTSSNLTVVVDLLGSSHFSKYPTSRFITIPHDSSSYVQVSYHASIGDTSYGWLSVSDSISQWDTLAFTGIDTGHTSTGIDFSISGSHTRYLGNYYNAPDSTYIRIDNNSSSAKTISATLSNNAYGMTIIGSSSQSISGGNWSNFYLVFNSNADSALGWLIFSDSSGRDSIRFMGRRSHSQTSSGHLWMPQTIVYDTLDAGDTNCRYAILRNDDSSRTIVISNIVWPNAWSATHATLPISIAPHDSLLLDLCFIGPNSPNYHAYGNLTATYHYSGDSTNFSRSTTLHGYTRGCGISLTPSMLYFEPVRVGGTATAYLTVNNSSHTDRTLSSVGLQYGTTSRFTVLTSLPLTVPHDSSARISIRFDASNADTDAYYTQVRTMMSDSACGYASIYLIGQVDLSAVDTTVMKLLPDQEETLELEGDSASVTKQFRFYNNTSANVKVVGVAIDDTAHFSITGIAPHEPDLTLAPGDTMIVSVHFDADTNGTFNANLIITTEGGLKTTIFHLVVHETGWVAPIPLAVRRHASTPLAISVSPNPSNGPVAIVVDGAKTSTMEIVDVLGAVVATQVGQHWTWSHASSTAGTYFVRVIGTDAKGNAFVESRRIVIQR